MNALIFLLILSFLVIIHELGHLLTAIWAKVKVEEFGVGYPPKALTLFRWKGIPFTLNWLPFGGFVRMEGEDQLTSDGAKESKAASNIGPFYTKSKRARLVVLLAGVFLNFVFGVIAFAIVYTKMGIPTEVLDPIVESVAEGSPASSAGIQVGDLIFSIARQCDNPELCEPVAVDIETRNEVVNFVNAHLGEELVVSIRRGGEVVQTTLVSRLAEDIPDGQGAIGVSFQTVVYKFYPWWQMPFRGIGVGIQQSLAFGWMVLAAFVGIFAQIFTQGSVPEGVAGPVGIMHQATKERIFQQGWENTLGFAGMLSINLAVLNILPIPALDGGRAVFVLLETLFSKKRLEKIEAYSNYIGFGFLLLFIGLITVKDIFVLIKDLI